MTGRPAYHPATLLKVYTYGYLNRIQSSRRSERETQRNVELIWLTGRLMPVGLAGRLPVACRGGSSEKTVQGRLLEVPPCAFFES